MKKYLLFTTIVLTQAFSFAITEEEESKLCWDSAASTHDMNVCADKDFQVADKHLNETYKAFKAAISDDKETTKRLVAAQKAWLKFRDANCQLEGAAMLGGTAATSLVIGCRARVTKERTVQLETQKEDLTTEPGNESSWQ